MKIRSVKYFPYRTALPVDIVATIPRENMYSWEKRLANECGVRENNHTGYLVETDLQVTFYLFSDCTVYVAPDWTEWKW